MSRWWRGPKTTSTDPPADYFRFRDRAHAGALLADELVSHAGDPRVIVLALPRGGVPVGFEIARRLRAPLDVFPVRKLGAPGHEELAIGAIAAGGVCFFNDDIIASQSVAPSSVEEAISRESAELARQETVFRGGRPPPALEGRVVILVDDGLATGATMRAAIEAVRLQSPARVIAAAPVSAPDTARLLQSAADELACVHVPNEFMGVGEWYDDFHPTTDDQVRRLLDEAAQFHAPLTH